MKPSSNIKNKLVTKDKQPVVEIRKHWDIPKADYIYAIYALYEEKECAMTGTGKHQTPDWNKIVRHQNVWGPIIAQGGVGDLEWAKKTAEHFGVEVPENEYLGEHDQPVDVK